MSNTPRDFLLVLVAGACVLPSAGTAQSATPSFVGSWRLESWTLADGTPRCSEEEGSSSGQIIYTGDGHMADQLSCSEIEIEDLSDLSAQAVVRRLGRRHLSYYGTYTLDASAQAVTYHVEGTSNLSFVGTDRVRSFVFEGNDRLVLSPPEGSRIVWLRNR